MSVSKKGEKKSLENFAGFQETAFQELYLRF